ncbi:hypothetical protein AB0M05_08740 [Streptomyces violaceusniger]|uniref:hypothetical protein n=1 Tax=Streptomyces violaceusniger TaxID=68280 RepID=UPI00343EDB5E
MTPRGTARIIRSTPGVKSSSIAHFRNAALMPVSAMPWDALGEFPDEQFGHGLGRRAA